MKTHINRLIIIFLLGSFFSCENDEGPAAPVISNYELGNENNKTGFLGNNLHVGAGIVSEAKFDKIELGIYHPGEQKSWGSLDKLNDQWEFDTTYLKFNGLRSTGFQERVPIPFFADTGMYHFHLKVFDLVGNVSEIEDTLFIKQPEDTQPPAITVLSSPGNGFIFINGDVISISGTLSDNIALGEIYVGLVRADQNLADSEVSSANTITLLNKQDFNYTKSYTFTASITVNALTDNDIPPKSITGNIAWQSGNYYILVKAKDAFGGNLASSEQFPVVLNLP